MGAETVGVGKGQSERGSGRVCVYVCVRWVRRCGGHWGGGQGGVSARVGKGVSLFLGGKEGSMKRTAYLNGHGCWWGLRKAGWWLCSCVG